MHRALKDNQSLLINLHFGLDFISDAVLREEMLYRFYNEGLVYDDVSMQADIMQHNANRIKDYYNKMYSYGLLEYNPIDNYDRYEEYTDETNASSSGKSSAEADGFKYPFDQPGEKRTDKQLSSGNVESAGKTVTRHTGHLRGNIGVTTPADMIIGDIRVQEYTKKIVDRYLNEFNNFFMITI